MLMLYRIVWNKKLTTSLNFFRHLTSCFVISQLQLNENSQPIWTEFMLLSDEKIHIAETEPSTILRITSGLLSHDGE